MTPAAYVAWPSVARCPHRTPPVRFLSVAVVSSRFVGRLATSETLPWVMICVLWILIVVAQPPAAKQGDVLRFYQIAHGGTPYVDQQVEYPPVETAVVRVVGAGSLAATALILSLINAIATVVTWQLLGRHWGRSVAKWFLWFCLPLQVFMPFRLDAVPVALTVAAIVLADRQRATAGGVTWATAALFKVWPAVLLPLLVIKRQIRTLWVALVCLAVGLIVWIAVSGPSAVRQVESFRGAAGWHIESVFGVMASFVSHEAPRVEAGASRVGYVTGWETTSLRLLTLFLIALAWWIARRRAVDPAGGPSLASLASLLVLSPLASPQYVLWLLPSAAIVTVERRPRDVKILSVGAAFFAGSVFLVYWGDPYAVRTLLILAAARGACIIGLAVIGFTHRVAQMGADHPCAAPSLHRAGNDTDVIRDEHGPQR